MLTRPHRFRGVAWMGLERELQSWHLTLPPDVAVGDELPLEVEVGDDTIVEPFVNRLTLRVIHQGNGGGGNGGTTSSNRGRGDRGGSTNLTLPEVIPVKESDWAAHGFSENDALEVDANTRRR